MALPSTLSNAAFLVAQNKVQLAPSVTIQGEVWSAGTVGMQPDVSVQTVICTGNVALADRDTITSLTLGGVLTRGNRDVIGTLTRTSLSNVVASTSVTFPPASQTVVVNSGQSRTLSPGAYVGVTASSGSTLTLLAGDYYLSSLILESGSVLQLSPTQGATRIFVASSMAYRPRLASGADASRLFVEYLGTNPVVLEKPFWGSLVAPRASLAIGTANSQLHRGSFMAQSIEVQPSAKLEFVPFNPAGTTSSCPTQTWDPDGNPFTPCAAKTVCAPGSYVTSTGSSTSDRRCSACTSGQFSTTNNALGCAAWTTCTAGNYVANTPSSTVDRVCLACPAGQYTSGSNQSQCLSQGSCAAGTAQTTAGTPTSPAVCAACMAGQYCAGGPSPQTDCALGTWDNDLDSATQCVAKTMCLPGSYVADEGTTTTDRTCAPCASGSFSATSNATACMAWTTCPAGSFVANSPSTTLDRVCSLCPAGQYSSSDNQTSCQSQGTCAAGSEQIASGTPTSPAICAACPPGRYCAGGTSSQVACAVGTWDHDGSAATPCVDKTGCAPGSFVASEGSALADRVCAACASGQLSTTTNASGCTPWTDCAAGTFVSNTPSATADRACQACPSGQYSSNSNQSSCQDQGSCAAGTAQTAAGTSTSATVCQACVAGQYCAGGASPAVPCSAGTWDDDSNPATPCVLSAQIDGGDDAGSTVLLEGAVLHSGETLVAEAFEITAPAGAVSGSVTVSARTVSTPSGLPIGFTPAAAAVDITIDPQSSLRLPLLVKLYYRDWERSNSSVMTVLHYDNEVGYEPVTILGDDPVRKYVLFEGHSFSRYQIGSIDEGTLPAQWPPSGAVTFSPTTNGWPIANFGDADRGSPFSNGGNCLGMSAYAVWFYEAHPGFSLTSYLPFNNRWPPWDPPPFPEDPNHPYVSTAHLTAIRAQQAQSQYWAWFQHKYDILSCMQPSSQCFIDDRTRRNLMKYNLSAFNLPQVLGMYGRSTGNVDSGSGGAQGGHATVLYRYEGDTFYFYDVNDPVPAYPGVRPEHPLEFDATVGARGAFKPIDRFNDFGVVEFPDWMRRGAFPSLTTEAVDQRFKESPLLSIDQPVAESMVTSTGATAVAGSTSSTLPTQIYMYSDSAWRFAIPPTTSAFSTSASTVEGRNVLVLLGGEFWREGVDKYGKSYGNWTGSTLVRDYYACPPGKAWNLSAGACRECGKGVYPQSISIRSAKDLDVYEGYTGVSGSVTVSGAASDVVNLDKLRCLRSIDENLWIEHNDALTSIDLENLAFVGGYVYVFKNGALTNLGLNGLTSVGRVLDIYMNDALSRVALGSLAAIGDSAYIYGNSVLPRLDLGSLVSVGRFVDISLNNALTDLNLGRLTSLGTYLDIINNAVLTTLDLKTLSFVGDRLRIGLDRALTSVELKNITAGNYISIYANPVLTSVAIEGGATPALYISGNAAYPQCAACAMAVLLGSGTFSFSDNLADACNPSCKQ